MFDIFLKNGEILPIEKAVVSLDDIAYTYGYGVYESLRVRKGVPYFVGDHIDRLLASAQIIDLEHEFSSDQLVLYVARLVDHLPSEKTYNIKIFLIGGKSSGDAWVTMQGMAPVFPDKKLYRHGASVITQEYRRMFPQSKSLNMLPSYLAYSDARKAGCYDALFLDDGKIVEGSRTNVFALQGEKIISPPEDEILHGVGRRNLLFIAGQYGIDVVEGDIELGALSDYDCLLLTSTSSKVMPVTKVDHFEFPNVPSLGKKLMKWYDEFLNESKGVFPIKK